MSTRPTQRMKDHFIAIRAGVHKNPHLAAAVTKHGVDNIICEVILSGEKEFCYQTENTMRPAKSIGWNIAPGGYRGPGKKKGTTRVDEILAKKKPTASDIEYLNNRKEKLEEKTRQKELAVINRMKEPDFIGRAICQTCNKNFCAINYIRIGITHYRSRCDECGRKKKLAPRRANWIKSRYKKKATCDLCGFHSVYPSQLTVFHIDGSLENIDLTNLRTICLCCVEVVKRKQVTWKRGDLIVD